MPRYLSLNHKVSFGKWQPVTFHTVLFQYSACFFLEIEKQRKDINILEIKWLIKGTVCDLPNKKQGSGPSNFTRQIRFLWIWVHLKMQWNSNVKSTYTYLYISTTLHDNRIPELGKCYLLLCKVLQCMRAYKVYIFILT